MPPPSTSTNCLTRDELARLTLGTLDADRLEVAERHLDECPRCLARLREEQVEDPLTTALESAATVHQEIAPLAEPIRQLIRHLSEQTTRLPLGPPAPALEEISPTSPSSTSTEVFVPGQVVGNYVIEGLLGHGGMGVVYRAHHRRLDRTVALKVLSARQGNQVLAASRFQAEAKTLARLSHPRIVTAHDADESNGVQFLVMEYVDGSNLASLVQQRGPLPIEIAVGYVIQAAEGLAYAHSQGIIHRDIKPANLVLDREGMIKVLDLGLARFGDASVEDLAEKASSPSSIPLSTVNHPGHSSRETVMGTLEFMAPEQAEDARSADPRSDIYSLGSTLRYLLTGQTVLGDGSISERLAALLKQPPPSVCDLRPEVPEELAAVMARLLARRAEERFSSMTEVITALRPFATRRDDQPRASDHRTHRSQGIVMAASVAALLSAVLAWGAMNWHPTSTGAPRSPTADQRRTGESLASEIGSPLSHTLNEADRLTSVLKDSAKPDSEAWRGFRFSEDPTLRTDLIHRLAPAGVPLLRILDRLEQEPDPHARAALLLAIGEYPTAHFRGSEQARFVAWLREAYERDGSPAVHGAIAWLAKRWETAASGNTSVDASPQDASPRSFAIALADLRSVLEQKVVPRDGGWYHTMRGHTLVVIPGPTTFRMGSPESEAGRVADKPQQDESQRTVTIPRTFAIATTETTRRQFHLAQEWHWQRPDPELPDHPQQGICWDDAAWYCNRLSDLEGIPPKDQCYEIDSSQPGAGKFRERPNALDLPGYRLPTDEEWELACRAGTATPRPFGGNPAAARYYAHWQETASGKPRAVGLLKPNDLGLFDTLGNVSELTHDRLPGEDSRERRLRGGSVFTELNGLRSAARYHMGQAVRNQKVGFRVARTITPRQLVPEQLTELQVGPPSGPTRRLPDGKIQSPDEFTAFGQWDTVSLGTKVRGTRQARRFRLLNPTDALVQIVKCYLGGELELLEPLPQVIPARGHVEFQVAVAERPVGPRWGELTLNLESGGKTWVHVGRISGNVIGPRMQILEFGEATSLANGTRIFNLEGVPQNSIVRHKFTMFHCGNRPLEVSDVSASGLAKVEPNWTRKLSTEPFGWFEIQVDTSQLGVQTHQIQIRTNDALEPVYEFEIRARVLEPHRFSVPGVFRRGLWLFDHNRDGVPDEQITFGQPADRPVTGDVNGDGITDLGVCRLDPAGQWEWRFHLRGVAEQPSPQTVIRFGAQDGLPLLVDRTGNGVDRPAIVAPDFNQLSLLWKFDMDGDGNADELHTFLFGSPHMTPVVGDWNGDGIDDFGCVETGGAMQQFVNTWRLGHGVNRGDDTFHPFGNRGDLPAVGDWNGDGRAELGAFRPEGAIWVLGTREPQRLITTEFQFGESGDIPVVLAGPGRSGAK